MSSVHNKLCGKFNRIMTNDRSSQSGIEKKFVCRQVPCKLFEHKANLKQLFRFVRHISTLQAAFKFLLLYNMLLQCNVTKCGHKLSAWVKILKSLCKPKLKIFSICVLLLRWTELFCIGYRNMVYVYSMRTVTFMECLKIEFEVEFVLDVKDGRCYKVDCN